MSKLFCFITFTSVVSTPSVWAFTHVAKEGDTLSDILYAHNVKPIYGKRGMLLKTLKLNPKIKYSKGDKIFPGTLITVPDEFVSQDEVNVLPEQNTEVAVVVKDAPEVIPAPIVEKVEAPTVTPGPEQRVVSNVFDQSFFWKISPGVSWKELSSKDSNAIQNSSVDVLSDMSYGADVTYGMRFSESLDIYSRLFLESVQFSTDNSIRILKKSVFTSQLAVGAFVNKKWQMELGMSDELFLTSPDALSVDVKKVSLPYLKAGFKNEFYQFQEATLSYALTGRVLMPRSYAGIDPKISYGAGAGIEAKLRNQSFLIGYEESFLKSSGNSTDSKNIFWRYTWETP